MLIFEAWPADQREGRLRQATRKASRALEGAIAAGLGYSETAAGGRLFDPVEVDQFLDWSAINEPRTTWGDDMAAANNALVDEARSGAAAGAHSQRFKVRLRRSFSLDKFGAGSKLRLRMPLPLVCEYHRDFSLTRVLHPGNDAAVFLSEGRLEVRLTSPSSSLTTIGADVDLVALIPRPAVGNLRLSAGDAEIYLRPCEGMIRVTPRVRALSASLAGTMPPLEALARFRDYMTRTMRFCFVRYDEVPVDLPIDWALDRGVYDCQLCSAMLVSLCRAAGVPARIVGGVNLFPGGPTSHNWAEVWIDDQGWLPVDVVHRERARPNSTIGLDPWDHFKGRGDYRIAMQQMPLAFIGPMSVHFPAAWQMLHAAADDGVTISYIDIADGSLIFEDRIAVNRVG